MCATRLEDVTLAVSHKFEIFGDRSRFALELCHMPDSVVGPIPEQSIGSWGEWRLWIADINLCELRLETPEGIVEVEEVRWFLAPLFRWIVENWMPLLHEKRLPTGGRLGDSRPRSARSAYLAMLESAGDDFVRFSPWQNWAIRHSLRTASEGGILPDVFFQRMEDDIELSWGERVQPGAETAAFVMEDGIARASVDEVATALFSAVEWFLEQDEVKASQWGHALTTLWCEINSKPAGIPALSWYLDSNPEPQSLTEKFRNALDELGKPLALTEKPWWGILAPEIAMFGDLSPKISEEAAVRLLAEYFDALTDTGILDNLEKLLSEEPAWATSSPWHNGYSLALDILDEIDPEPKASMTQIEKMLENLGVRVKDVELDEQGPRGVALAGDNLRPTVLVNKNHLRNQRWGKRFTLAHELCHILFDQSRARPLAHSSTPWASPSVEQRANAFAAMLLMPPTRAKRPAATDWTNLKEAIDRLAERMKVSRVALKRHLTNINQIDPDELDFLLGNQSRDGSALI